MLHPSKNLFPNRVAELFQDKTILITGGTGFLGKVLIEKLLRTCSSLKKIYVIIREKNEKNATKRLQEICDGPLFEKLRQQKGATIFDKIEAIDGDVIAPDLGLSETDRQKLIQETEIIYHSAASIKFDEPLKSAVLLNVRGTKSMLELAEECKNLLVFCHLSTAYCHEKQEVLLDTLYPPPADPHCMIKLCECMNEETLSTIDSTIRGWSANNYTFSKALTEALVEEKMDKLPVVIQRPTAIIPTWKEPIPGWTDNINGPAGLLIGAGKGVIRTMYAKDDAILDCLPVDSVINLLICSTYDYVTYRSRRVYNLTISREVKVTANKLLETGRQVINTKIPFDMVIWYPNGSLKSSRLSHYIHFLLFQLLPAFFIDAIFLLIGVKPFLVRVQKKVLKGYQIFEYYVNREWDFRHDNMNIIRDYLNPREKEEFIMDPDGFDFHTYITDCMLGARRYILKEPDDGISSALKRMKMLWLLDKVCKIVFTTGILYYMCKFFLFIYSNKVN
ncbi:hypothetical protein Zmor_018200 [Zophobas morio]|uniref:Fatty acyl-CoA reductase n=1 Tax=Zophobas morio TaxID=2755281 RepID=A0AA38IA26_9CUCU|nr:hypothetical protein Zmor_018200 [Zophobas morio]